MFWCCSYIFFDDRQEIVVVVVVFFLWIFIWFTWHAMYCIQNNKISRQLACKKLYDCLYVEQLSHGKVAPRCWPLQSVKSNRPFPSCLKPLFQGEAKCEAIDTKMVFIQMQIKLIFTKRGFALSLVSNDESLWNLLPIVNNCVTTNVVKFSLDLQHLVPLLLDPDLPPPRGQMVPPLTANRVLKLNYSLSTWPEVNVLVRALLRPGIFNFKLRVLWLKELIASCGFMINLASTVSSYTLR